MEALTDCVVCGRSPAGGVWRREDDESKSMPVCQDCFESGAFEKWFHAAEQEIQGFAARYAMESSAYTGNLYRDLMMVRAHLKHEANIEDGVCPNSCARLNDLGGGDFQCPVCNFVLHKRTI